jgi:starvation-inducible outer membrane lipoprotein
VNNIKRILRRWKVVPSVSYTNFAKAFPNSGPYCWTRWFSVNRYWGGKIINISVKHHSVSLDFRRNWIADMIDPMNKANL